MSKNKILIIGKKSFIGTNLKNFLEKEFEVKIMSLEDTMKKKESFFSFFSHILNTTINKKYIFNKYSSIYDFDKRIVDKFRNPEFTYIFLNTRKIYSLKENITETSKLNPKNNYEKNKLITELYLKKKLKRKLLSLRISNIIGLRKIKNNTRNHHKLFFDNYLDLKKKEKIIEANDDYKDFLSINQFSKIVQLLINKNVNGIYNVSLSEKVYISEITKWLDINTFNKIKFTPYKKDSFTLSNKKLVNKIQYKPTKKELKLFCKKIFN